MHFLNSEEKEKWIENYVDRETAQARQRVEAADAVIRQEQKVTETAENSGLTTRELKITFHKMIVAIRDSLSNIASSDNGEDGEDEYHEETAQGKLSEDDEPSWVMGTIPKMVDHRMERFRQKQIKLDKLTQRGWGDAADHFLERYKKYGTSELRVLAVVQPQTDRDVAAPALTTLGALVECRDIVPGRSQIPQGTS